MLNKPTPETTIRPVTAADLPEVSALHARVFGPGRFARTAYRVREGRDAADFSRFCRLARVDGTLIAALRMTEISIGGTPGALLLGPLAVAPEATGQGYGRALIEATIAAAREAGIAVIVLVGDEPYYGRFGFTRTPPGSIVFPGPVNPARILTLDLKSGTAAPLKGAITLA